MKNESHNKPSEAKTVNPLTQKAKKLKTQKLQGVNLGGVSNLV